MVKMESVDEMKQMHKAQNAFLAGCISAWVTILRDDPEMLQSVIETMDAMATDMRKAAGVTIG